MGFVASTVLRLTKAPDLKDIVTDEGPTQVCEIRGAVKAAGRGFKTGYFNFFQYGSAGAAAANVLKKGQQVEWTGRIEHVEWREKDTNKYREGVEFIGRFDFLDKKTGDDASDDPDRHLSGSPPLGEPVPSGSKDIDDIPF